MGNACSRTTSTKPKGSPAHAYWNTSTSISIPTASPTADTQPEAWNIEAELQRLRDENRRLKQVALASASEATKSQANHEQGGNDQGKRGWTVGRRKSSIKAGKERKKSVGTATALRRSKSIKLDISTPRMSSELQQAAKAASSLDSTQLGYGSSGTALLVENEFDGQKYCVKQMVLDSEDKTKWAYNEARIHAKFNHTFIIKYCFSWMSPGEKMEEGELVRLTGLTDEKAKFNGASKLVVAVEDDEVAIVDLDGQPTGLLPENYERLDGAGISSFCILMELCSCDLYEHIESTIESGGVHTIQSRHRSAWSLQMATALAHIHEQRIIHRDFNPWNVFISLTSQEQDTPAVVKVGDFGLSVAVPEGAVLSGFSTEGAADLDDSAVGSPYSAPELGSERYSFPADVFSLGLTVFFTWCTQLCSIDDVDDHVMALREKGTLPDGFEGICTYSRLIQAMVDKDPTKCPSVTQVVEEMQRADSVVKNFTFG